MADDGVGDGTKGEGNTFVCKDSPLSEELEGRKGGGRLF